jgi:hypothetical protein
MYLNRNAEFFFYRMVSTGEMKTFAKVEPKARIYKVAVLMGMVDSPSDRGWSRASLPV